jgi:hypothetical protein
MKKENTFINGEIVSSAEIRKSWKSIVDTVNHTKTQLNTKTHKFMLENLREIAQTHNLKLSATCSYGVNYIEEHSDELKALL